MEADGIEDLRIRGLHKRRLVAMMGIMAAMNIRTKAVMAATIVADEEDVGGRGGSVGSDCKSRSAGGIRVGGGLPRVGEHLQRGKGKSSGGCFAYLEPFSAKFMTKLCG